METSARDAASYVQAALDLTPDVRQLHQEIERDRMLPPALVTTIADAGFFSLWLSRTFGGPELSFTECARVIEAPWGRRSSAGYRAISRTTSCVRFSVMAMADWLEASTRRERLWRCQEASGSAGVGATAASSITAPGRLGIRLCTMVRHRVATAMAPRTFAS